jgi:hypothetical protein
MAAKAASRIELARTFAMPLQVQAMRDASVKL